MRIISSILPALVLFASCSGGDTGGSGGYVSDGQEYLGNLLDSFYGEEVYMEHLPEMPDDGCSSLRTRRFSSNFHRMFNDSNYVQISAADSVGISPVMDAASAWNLRRPLVRINSCEYYFVDTLKHSYPYLVPEAAKLAADIGKAFNDSLKARGGGEYRMRLTSVLRTESTVKRLRRVNRNAVDSSAHQYATTFDIAYNKFICDGTNHPRTSVDLKNMLAEIIEDMRLAGRCYVKYEYRQACFHITVRPDGSSPLKPDYDRPRTRIKNKKNKK